MFGSVPELPHLPKIIPKTVFQGKATLVSGASPFDTAPPVVSGGGSVTTGGGGNQNSVSGLFGSTTGGSGGGGGDDKSSLPPPTTSFPPRAQGQGLVSTKTIVGTAPKAAADLFGGSSSSSAQVTRLSKHKLINYLVTNLVYYLSFLCDYLIVYRVTQQSKSTSINHISRLLNPPLWY